MVAELQIAPAPSKQAGITEGSGKSTASRFCFVDGLRGLAALSVVFFHMTQVGAVYNPTAKLAMPPFLHTIAAHGDCGVQVFFVLSGFVIAHSLRKLTTWRDAATFLLRRQIRLCPPYWAVVLIIALGSVPPMHFATYLGGGRFQHTFTLRDIVANLLYCQYPWHAQLILGPAWTLCLEVRFYILVTAILLTACYIRSATLRDYFGVALMFLIGLWCLPVAFHDGWTLFAAGFLAYTATTRHPLSWLFLILLTLMFYQAIMLGQLEVMIGTVTASCLYLASRLGTMTTWLSQRPFQYLGKISYSLYLININICAVSMKLAFKTTGGDVLGTQIWMLIGIGLSIAAAELLYRLIERPSLEASKRLKQAR